MINKQTFCEIIELMKEQDAIDNKLSEDLELIGDGHYLLNSNNKRYEALDLLLKKAMKDEDNYISWYLYEDVKKVIWLKDGTEVDVLTPELLYDFLIENYEK